VSKLTIEARAKRTLTNPYLTQAPPPAGFRNLARLLKDTKAMAEHILRAAEGKVE